MIMAIIDRYRFREYVPGDLDAVAELQRFLLGENIAANRAYLRWKYHDNPLDSTPRAIVATHENAVVGFRGYVPSFWRSGDTGETVRLLALADTCVHRDHQRRGLFTRMTVTSLEAYVATAYHAIINLTTSARPARGYLKLGWCAFGQHGNRVRFSARGVLPRAISRFLGSSSGSQPGSSLARDGWELDREPCPEVMARLVASQGLRAGYLSLARDSTFYAWRFRNPRERYRFAWATADGGPEAFLVLRDEIPGRRGNIIDYAETRPGRLGFLVARLLAGRHYDSLSVWDVAPRSADGALWGGLGFLSLQRIRKLLRPFQKPVPLLIRPLALEPRNEDWIVAGHDLRGIDVWDLREICSDAT